MTPEERTAILFRRPIKKEPKKLKGTLLKRGDADIETALSPLNKYQVTLLAHRALSGASSVEAIQPNHEILKLNLGDALSNEYDKDAHIQPFHCEVLDPPFSVRVNKGLRNVKIFSHCVVFDWDREPKEKWTSEEEFKSCLSEMTQGPFLSNCIIYQTRNGLRALRPLSEPFLIGSNDGSGWKTLYTDLLKKLPVIAGGEWDGSTSDFTRLFRLPFVRRDKEDEKGFIWIPEEIHPYTVTSQQEALIIESEVSSDLVKKKTGTRNLVEFFDKIGLLGEEFKELNGQPAYFAECPFSHLHSSHSNPSSTILMSVSEGYVLHCKHASCRDSLSGDGYLRHLKTKYPDEWTETCEKDNPARFVYDPHNHTSFLNNAVTLLKLVYPDEMFRWEDGIVTLESSAWGYVKFRSWNEVDVCGALNRGATWEQVSTDKDGNVKTKECSIPLTAVKLAFSEICRALPVLKGKTALPPIDLEYFEPTRYKKGYCAETGMYFLPHASVDVDAVEQAMSKDPSLDKAIASFLKIKELYADFPFKKESQRMLAVCATMTAFLRRSIDGPAPLFFVSANSKGVGKTKLMQAVLASVYGMVPSLTSLPEKDEETRKLMDSLLFEDVDYCLIDNVQGGLGSANLDALITSDRYRSRMLGSSMTIEKPVRFFLGATGNNATLKGDTDRRAVMIRLVTELERPEERKGFRFPDLLKEARARQTDTWICVLEILRAFSECATDREKQEIEDKKKALGSFETWADVVRDPLMWLGAHIYPSQDVDVVSMSSEEIEQARGDNKGDLMDCLIQWQVSLNESTDTENREWSIKDLSDALKNSEDTGDENLQTLNGMLASNGISYVGRMVANKRDTVHGGYILKNKRSKGKRLNVLVPLEEKKPKEEAPLVSCEGFEEDPLVKNRCVHYLRGGCRKYKMDCEEETTLVTGGISESTYSAMKKLEQEREEEKYMQEELLKVPERINITEETVTRIHDLFQVNRTQKDIADALNKEQIKPPKGRVWTSSKVGAVIKERGFKKIKPKKPTSTDRLLEKKGTYKGYYPESHPLHVSTEEDTRVLWQKDKDNLSLSGHKKVDTIALLSNLAKKAVTPADLYLEGVNRRKEAEKEVSK